MAELFDSLSRQTHFVQYLITFCSQPEAAGVVISGLFVWPVVLDKYVKFHDPSLNRSREIPSEAGGGGIFDCFFPSNFRPEIDNDVLSDAAVENVGTDVCVKFGESRSNGCPDILGADFVSNERTNRTKPIPIVQNGVSTQKQFRPHSHQLLDNFNI